MTSLEPEFFLNYPGDVRYIVGEILGPNGFEELLVAVSATYDEKTNRTRVGLSLLQNDTEEELAATYGEFLEAKSLEQRIDEEAHLLPVVE